MRGIVKLTILVSLAIILTACGELPKAPDATFAPEVKKHLDVFIARYGVTPKFSIVMGKLDGWTIGECTYYAKNFNQNLIVIDSEYWAQATESEREEVLFHELGHCVFGRDHREDLIQGGNPASIMYPYAFAYTPFYKNNREYYLDELPDGEATLKMGKVGCSRTH